MTRHLECHWETGEEHAEFANSAGSPPVTDEVSASSPLNGGFSKRLVFGNSDNFEVNLLGVYTRSATSDSCYLHVSFWISDLADFDILGWMLNIPSAGSNSNVHASIKPDGSIEIRCGYFSGGSFGSNALLATSAAGVVSSATKHSLAMRVEPADSGGQIDVAIDNAIVVSYTGDTFRPQFGAISTGLGWGTYLSSVGSVSGSGELKVDDLVIGSKVDHAEWYWPQRFRGYVPNGVGATSDGTVFGGASDAADATDERPATDTDGFTLDNNGDAQYLAFENPTDLGPVIRSASLYAAMGDDADGAETVRVDLYDGTATETGSDVGMSTDYTTRRVIGILETPPSGGSWDSTKLDAIEARIVRTN